MRRSSQSAESRDAVDAVAAELRPPRSPGMANAVALLALGGLVFVGLTGFLGGGAPATSIVTNEAVIVQLEAPARLRSGMIGEIRVGVRGRSALAEPSIDIPGDWLRGITINETSPAPLRETPLADGVRLHFPPVAAGERLELTLSYQVNPDRWGGSSGTVRVNDGNRALVSLPVRLWVLP